MFSVIGTVNFSTRDDFFNFLNYLGKFLQNGIPGILSMILGIVIFLVASGLNGRPELRYRILFPILLSVSLILLIVGLVGILNGEEVTHLIESF